MRDKQWVALLDELPTDEESLEDFSRRRFPPRHPFSYQHYTFDVLDGDAWYRIDAKVPESEFYEGVPQSVQRRACRDQGRDRRRNRRGERLGRRAEDHPARR